MTRIIFPLILAAAVLVSGPVSAQSQSAQSAPSVLAPIEIAPGAPDIYTVVPGDTLWDISARFFSQPWRWPEVWRMNREEISNPHLIYPGQVIMLDRSGPYLSIGKPVGVQRLSPKVYTEPLDTAIASIPVHLIAPFLTRPLVVDQSRLTDAATIVATESSRVYLGEGDTVFAKDVVSGNLNWQIFRPAKPLEDPVTGELLAYEAQYLGTAQVTEYGTPSTLRIIEAIEEIGPGDRLVQSEQPQVFAYVPRASMPDLDGRIIGIYRGVVETGRYNVVTLNVGSFDGVDEGQVVALYRNRGSVEYEEDGTTEVFELPEKRYGLAFIFRAFERVAYALVMDSDGQVTMGDSVRAP